MPTTGVSKNLVLKGQNYVYILVIEWPLMHRLSMFIVQSLKAIHIVQHNNTLPKCVFVLLIFRVPS